MRIFKYWKEVSQDLIIDGEKQSSKTFGGSNISLEDAIKDGERKLSKAQQLINGNLVRDENYEADIREEIIEQIDAENIVTRNRYGALILNSKHLMFIDVDEYPKSIFQKIFNRGLSKKALILRNIKKIASNSKYKDYGFRIYETKNGFRIMVANEPFEANSKKSKKILKDFRSDHLYRWLCIKQNCYRARLTPKPYRIKQKKIKITYPNQTKIQAQALANWVHEYEIKSQPFATCKFIEAIGRIYTSREIIDYHDRLTKANSQLKLA